MAWINVLEDDICNIMQNPTGSSNAVESQKMREKENKSRLHPKPAQENATQRPKPLTPVREASVKAPSNAPTPVAPMRMPKPFGPPCSTLSANIGISTM